MTQRQDKIQTTPAGGKRIMQASKLADAQPLGRIPDCRLSLLSIAREEMLSVQQKGGNSCLLQSLSWALSSSLFEEGMFPVCKGPLGTQGCVQSPLAEHLVCKHASPGRESHFAHLCFPYCGCINPSAILYPFSHCRLHNFSCSDLIWKHTDTHTGQIPFPFL